MTPEEKSKIIIHHSDLRNICKGLAPDDYTEQMLCLVEAELRDGFDLIKRHPHTITFFGSARTYAAKEFYEETRSLAQRLTKELGVTIATGGGPGLMEAANKGAYEVDPKRSIGMPIKLPNEQGINDFVGEAAPFQFFFTRKVIMTYMTDAFVVCPGGYGTLNELFEILTLVQTKKMQPVPVILFGKNFWEPLKEFIDKTIEERGEDKGFINPEDDMLFLITDSEDEIVSLFSRLKIGKK